MFTKANQCSIQLALHFAVCSNIYYIAHIPFPTFVQYLDNCWLNGISTNIKCPFRKSSGLILISLQTTLKNIYSNDSGYVIETNNNYGLCPNYF